MRFLYAYKIHWYIYKKKSIFIKYIYQHWQFDCNSNQNSQKINKVESNINSLSQKSLLPETFPQQNFVSSENLFLTSFSISEFPRSPKKCCLNQNPSSIKKAILLGNSYLAYLFPPVNLWLPLDLRLQEIEKLFMVSPYD